MKNFVQQGNVITVLAPAIVKSGDGVLVQNTFGIASYDAAQNEEVEIELEGVFTLPKAVVPITQRVKVYWDDTNKNVTTNAAGNILIGVATITVIDTDPEVNVRLNGAF